MTEQPPYAAQPPYPAQPHHEQPYQQYAQYPQYPQGPVAPDGRPLAGQGQRLGARFIDGLIVLVATVVVAGAIGAGLAALLESSTVADDSPVVPITMVSLIVILVLGIHYLYEVELALRWNGQTPGKRVLKIAISPLEPGVPLTRKRLATRFGVLFAFNLLSNCYVGLLDPLWCLWDKPYRQCLHDKPAKTVVIEVRPPQV